MEITKKKLFILSQFVFIQLSGAMEPNYDRQLIDAARRGNLELARHALENGANANAVDYDGSVLALAASSGEAELVKLLIAYGAHIHLGGWNPITSASTRGHVEIVKILLDCGTHVDATNNLNATALIEASYYGQTNVVKLLIGAGADVNAQDDFGWTALKGAVLKDEPEIVKLLLNVGADIGLKDNNGYNAFVTAQQHYYPENKQVLMLLESVQEFLDHPLQQITAHPENINDYLAWSIAYKKDPAYKHLITVNPDILTKTKNLVHYFLIAARVGNAHAFNSLKTVLRELKPAGYTFIFLKSLDLIMKLQPELVYLAYQVLTEDIAPMQVASEK